MTDLLLYHHPTSYYSQIGRLVMVESGLDWRGRFIDIGPRMENYDPWYARLNPEMVVPVLVDGGEVVTETVDIARYVDREHPESNLTADHLPEQAVEQWASRIADFPVREFAYGTLPPAFVRRKIHNTRLSTIREHLASNPELAETYETRLEDIEQWEEVSSDPEAVEALEGRLEGILEEAESSLQEHDWIAGDAYSRADAFLTGLLARLDFMGQTSRWTGGARPNLAGYYARVQERPSFTEADVWNQRRPLRLACLILRSLWYRLVGRDSRHKAPRQLRASHPSE